MSSNYFKKAIGKLNIKQKMIIAFVSVALIPTIVLIVGFYNNLFGNDEWNPAKQLKQRQELEAQDIAIRMKDIENVGYAITFNKAVRDFVNNSPNMEYMERNHSYMSTVKPIIAGVKPLNMRISKYFLFTSSPKIPEVDIINHSYKYSSSTWYRNMQIGMKDKLSYWEGYHKTRTYRGEDNSSYSFSLFCRVPMTSGGNFIELQVPATSLLEDMHYYQVTKAGVIFPIAEDGSLIFKPDDKAIESIMDDKSVIGSLMKGEACEFNYKNDTYKIDAIKIEELGIYIATIIPKSEVESSRATLIGKLICGIIIMLSIIICLAIAFANVWMKAIKTFLNAIEQVKNQNYNVKLEGSRYPEIDRVMIQFNEMVDKINELVNQVLMLKIKHRDERIAALLNQINPHFIYNTLESIKMMAEINDDIDVADALASFGNMVRYNVSADIDEVTIENEMDHIKDYIAIENILHDGELKLEIHVDKEILSKRIPKLIFQPIVENSIKYGKEYQKRLNIMIVGEEFGDTIQFRIADSGPGFEFNVLRSLNTTFSNPVDINSENENKGETHGIALKNINSRIKLLYGMEYGLFIKRDKTNRTIMIITLPN